MNLSSIPFLATAIAIIISWALFAIFCSLLHEALAQVVAERGRFMRRYLLKQLQDLPNGINWASLLYLHGSVDMLTRANNKPTSYIAPELFAKTLVEVVGNSHLVQTQIEALKRVGASRSLTSNTAEGFADEGNNYAHSALYNFKAAVQLLKPSDIVEFFGQSLRDAEIRADANATVEKPANESEVYKLLTANIETWYKDFSDRLTLWYKKHVRRRLLWIGLLLGIVINVDSVQLFQFYNANPESRAAVISYYEKNSAQLNALANRTDSLIKKEQPISRTDTITGNIVRRVVTDTSAGNNISDLGKKIFRDSLFQVSQSFFRSADSLRKAANIPVGFEYSIFKNYKKETWWERFLKLIGIIVTGFAASFGAPFWFDVLRKLVR